MELMLIHYFLLGALWATLTFQIFLDENHDGQQQPSEPSLAGHTYTLTWVDGDTSSVALGATDANGYLQAEGQGALTLDAGCATYTAQVGDVAGQAVIPLACPAQMLYLPQLHGPILDAEIERLQGEMRDLLGPNRGDR
jgi:hypothetical protein